VADGERREARRGWLLLAVAVSGASGLSPVQLERSLFLVCQKREEHVGPDFYGFESNGSGPASPALYVDIDALVTAEYVVKEWVPESSCSIFRLSEAGRAWAADFRRKMKKEALAGLEDAVAWVKEQSYQEMVHKTSTVRVIR
jgi:DNA-binding PadR family transcriptional regulator